MDKTVLRNLSYGMYVLGACDDGRPVGCIINTCIQVTSIDPVVAISVNKDNYTYEVIRRTGKFTISIIPEDVDPLIIPVFGFQCSKEKDKYKDFSYEISCGVPLLKSKFAGQLICEVTGMTDCGTHCVILGKVTDTRRGEGIPMTYDYYHKVIKGNAPKNAPTYQGDIEPQKEKPVIGDTASRYVCSVCGYVYDGDINKEPDDFHCPVCGVDKTMFNPA